MKIIFSVLFCSLLFTSNSSHAQIEKRVVYLVNKKDLKNTTDGIKAVKILGTVDDRVDYKGLTLYFFSCYHWDQKNDKALGDCVLMSDPNGLTNVDIIRMFSFLGVEKSYKLTGEIFDTIEEFDFLTNGQSTTVETDSSIGDLAEKFSLALKVLEGIEKNSERTIYLVNKKDLNNKPAGIKAIKIKGVIDDKGPTLYFSSCYLWDQENDRALGCVVMGDPNGLTDFDVNDMFVLLGPEKSYELTDEIFNTIEEFDSLAAGQSKVLETNSHIGDLAKKLSLALKVLD